MKPRAIDLFCGAPKVTQFQLPLYAGAKQLHAGKCLYCGIDTISKRPDKKYCSSRCNQRARVGAPKERACQKCRKPFAVATRADANRKYCSRQCSRLAGQKKRADWRALHPGAMRYYNDRRVEQNPKAYREYSVGRRAKIIQALGGRCIVCQIDNPVWLEVDFVTATRGEPFRHPRHSAYVLSHLDQFRLLCANHHRELSVTGRIDGTEITQ